VVRAPGGDALLLLAGSLGGHVDHRGDLGDAEGLVEGHQRLAAAAGGEEL
jgi:hypothetical protein